MAKLARHNYENISAPVPWKLVQDDLPPLNRVCRAELTQEASLRE
jgi:hypothetical protein